MGFNLVLSKSQIRSLKSEMSWRIGHDRRVFFMAAAAGLPAVLVALILLWTGTFTPKVQWTLTILIVAVWLGFMGGLRQRVVFPLQTLSNLLAALREGDYSIRGRHARSSDALGEVTREVNALADTLREQRLDALEATALLRKVMEEIDVAVFSFDGEHRLRLLNRAAERLLNMPSEGWLASSVTCSIGRQPRFERGRTEGLATHRACHWSRAEQLAYPNQVDFRKPEVVTQSRLAADRLGRRHAARPGYHRIAIRIAQPVHGSIRAACQAAAT